MSKRSWSPRYMTMKIHYGIGHRFSSAKELLEFIGEDWSISAHYDVFEERDAAKEEVKNLKNYLEKLENSSDKNVDKEN